jgi:hypothetical protein
MKVLIQNYNDILSTQNFYINQCLNMVDSVETKLWNTNAESTHDCLDRFQPDLVIANAKIIDKVLLKYLSENTKIKLIVNSSRCNQYIVDYLEEKIQQLDINCVLFFSEGYDFLVKARTKNIKFSVIMPSHDLFLNPPNILNFDIDNCIISNKYTDEYQQVCDKNKHYHKLIFGIDLHSQFDLESSISNISSLVSNYKEITLVGDVEFVCSQVFFDCMIKSEKVSVKPNAEQEELFLKVLSALFEEDQKDMSIEKVKDQIRQKHTCIHRVHQLLIDAGQIEEAKAVKQKFGEQNGQ